MKSVLDSSVAIIWVIVEPDPTQTTRLKMRGRRSDVSILSSS
jgi:hypothetical protein